MKVMSVDEDLYGALEVVADRAGRSVQDLVAEAIVSWLAESAVDEADHTAIQQSRAEAAELGGAEFEDFFRELLQGRD